MSQGTHVLSSPAPACPEPNQTPAPAKDCQSNESSPSADTWLPPPGVSPHELHRHFLRQAAMANWNAYRLMVLIRRMEACQGHRELGCVTLRQYVELICGVSAMAARERVRVALALERLPAIEAALAGGQLSYSKVRAVTRVATPETEAEWLATARDNTAEKIEYLVARSHKGVPHRRSLVTRALNEHTTRMTVDLPAEEMELVMRALVAVRKAAGGKLSASQALVYLAADCLAGETKSVSTAERYTVVVHMGKDGSAWLNTEAGDAPLRPQVVERLMCDCSVRLAQEDEEGRMSLSQRQRTVPLVTRRAVEIRDGCRCRVPGCQNRVWLDAHHVKPRDINGRNLRRNLILLCTQHHQLVHDHELFIEEREDGEVAFRSAGGWVLGEHDEISWNMDWAWAGQPFVDAENGMPEMEDGATAPGDDDDPLLDQGVSAEAGIGWDRAP